MSVIRARNLTKSYGSRTGVLGIDLDVPPGAIFGFIGPNGAGKTTFIRLLLGFLRPTAGEADVLEKDAWRHSAQVKRAVGYLPGDLRLYPWMTVDSALSVAGRVRGMDLRHAGGELVEHFKLDRDVKVRQMSRGMRQKLGIMLALAHDPKLIILDEPTTGLDPLTQDALIEYLRQRAQHGRTVFFSSHTLSEVETLCDRVAIVRRGRIVANETLQALRERAHRTVTIAFDDAAHARQTAPPVGLTVERRDRAAWHGTWDGPARHLVQWAASQSVHDLNISPPNLEHLFRAFYRDDELDQPSDSRHSRRPGRSPR